MHHLFTFLALAASTMALALPQGGSNDYDGVSPSNTTVYYYTGTTSNGNTTNCGYLVGQDQLDAGVCNKITTQGLSIQQVESAACTYTLYSGTTTCGGADSSQTTIAIPAGAGQTCFFTGVEDGGVHYLGSGIWTCD